MEPNFWDGAALQPSYLHLTPLNAHFSKGIHWTAIGLHKSASSNQWHGSVVKTAARALAVMGSLLNAPLALAEGALSLSLGSAGILMLAATGKRSEFLQRHAIKCLAYSVQSFMNLFLQIYFLSHNKFFSYHTLNSLYSQATYLSSAIAAQLVGGYFFDQQPARDPVNNQEAAIQLGPAVIRIGYLFIQHLPDALEDIMRGLRRDVQLGEHQQIIEIGFIREFLEIFPQYRATILRFSVAELSQENYRCELIGMIVEFLSYCQLIAPPDERARHAGEFVLNTNQAQDSAYQLQLHGYVKNALKDLYTNPMFLACLGQDEESGRLAIEGFYPEVYLPLAHYSQLKELEGELVCPAEFGSRDLQLYNNRRQQLEAASKALQNLSFRSREILIQKLLKRSEFELAEQGLEAEEEVLIHDLFIWITKLAGELHQGTLMSQTIINIANPDQLIGGQNLFQKAYQEALQEIT